MKQENQAMSQNCGGNSSPKKEFVMTTTLNENSWQMDALMERLRRKASHLRTMPESAKMIKQAVMNKQHYLEPPERAALGQCLDKLQQNIKVSSLPSMTERLESTARQLGLTFTSGTTGFDYYISCDMFYVEIFLQSDGKVRDIKVELAGEQNEPKSQSSPELIDCLTRGSFQDFASHLDGFLDFYNLNADKKIKGKAYQALQALEVDLTKLFEIAQESLSDAHRLIIKSPVGMLIRRNGGFPTKIVYFLSPYELLDVSAGRSISLTYDSAVAKDLAYFVSVSLSASSSHKLQTIPLVNIKKGADGLKLPSISGLSAMNSVSVPACFTLRLKNPMPMCLSVARRIGEITNIPCFEPNTSQRLLQLIINENSDANFDSNRGLYVSLPDQHHCYYMVSGLELEGVLVKQIAFTHPTSIAHILENLRAQAVFNTLITSCVRPSSKRESDHTYIFEVTAVSHDYISVTFEHPEEESTATAGLDLSDFSNAKCRIQTLGASGSFCSDEYATKVLQRCLSIPITMRALLKKVCKEEKKEIPPQGDSVLLHGSKDVTTDSNQNNTKFLFNDFNSLGNRRDHMVNQHAGTNNVISPQTAADGYAQESVGGHGQFFGSGVERSGPPGLSERSVASNVTEIPFVSDSPASSADRPVPVSTDRSVPGPAAFHPMANQKVSFPQHFLGDGKVAKVKKKKVEGDRKLTKDDINIDKSSDVGDHFGRKDKQEKFSLTKRRSSNDLSDSTNDLAALREKVYGAGSAANFAKLSVMHKETKDPIKGKKQKAEGSDKKSPIVLDLTDIEAAKKASFIASSTSSSSLNSAVLKRSGIEIIPLPGSNTPISIPSSITVTPVVKNSDDKSRDKRDKRDRRDIDRKDKKRKREDSPNNKACKVQIITMNSKHSTVTSLEKLKSENKVNVSNIKPSFQSPPKKTPLSPLLSKSIAQGKITYSPNQKVAKVPYNPSSHLSPSHKVTTSPKQSGENVKQPGLSPKHSMTKPIAKTTPPSSFSRPSLSPKIAKSKERSSSCSPSRHSSPIPNSPNISPTLQGKRSQARANFSDALTITKVSTGETVHSSGHTSVSPSQTIPYNASNVDKNAMDKAKSSPPKNRKGSSLSDIVDKLRAGASGSSGGLTILERKERLMKNMLDGRQEGENFTIKPSTGLKITINKSKSRESSKQFPTINSHSPTQQGSKGVTNKASGLKPGVLSGPASKKVSMSNFPPIPKLPRSSVSNVTNTAISPLNNVASMVHSSPLQYQRERPKEKDRSQGPEKIKSRESSDKQLCTDPKKESNRITKEDSNRITKEDSKLKLDTADDLDKTLKSIFGDPVDDSGFSEDFPNRVHLPKDITATKVVKADRTKNEPGDLDAEKYHLSGSRIMPPPSLPSKLHDKENMNFDEEKKSRDLSASAPPNHCLSKRSLSPPINCPPSPSLSIKIVKSPVAVTSPLNMISPQACQLSPCIIDDDLMDEALMGSRK